MQTLVDVFDEAVKSAGGAASVADAMGESLATVWNWRSRGVPANRCQAFSALTGASVKALRPNDWHEYWPEPKRSGKSAKASA